MVAGGLQRGSLRWLCYYAAGGAHAGFTDALLRMLYSSRRAAERELTLALLMHYYACFTYALLRMLYSSRRTVEREHTQALLLPIRMLHSRFTHTHALLMLMLYSRFTHALRMLVSRCSIYSGLEEGDRAAAGLQGFHQADGWQ